MNKSTRMSAGIDTGKHKLDAPIDGRPDRLQLNNEQPCHASLAAWLQKHGVERVGIEASGGYERPVVAYFRAQGVNVLLFQPQQVRAYAMFRLQRGKNDTIDAAPIPACTAAVKTLHPPPHPRFSPLAESLTS